MFKIEKETIPYPVSVTTNRTPHVLKGELVQTENTRQQPSLSDGR